MPSETELCNQSLGHLAVADEIQNLTTERSAAAKACRRFYEVTRDEVLRSYAWPFATRNAALALIAENPTAEWGYSYRVPSDCLMFRKILSGIRTDAPETRVPYRTLSDATGNIIYTDLASAVGEYTAKITDPTRFAPDFITALTYLLAVKIAPRVTGGDPFKLGDAAAKKYLIFISVAEANAANEQQPDTQRESEFVRIRGGSDALQKTFLGQKIQNFPAQDE